MLERRITARLIPLLSVLAWTACGPSDGKFEDDVDAPMDEEALDMDQGGDDSDINLDPSTVPDGTPAECTESCTRDEDCGNDDIFCNGRHVCDPEMRCCVLEEACGSHPDACMQYTCVEELARCVDSLLDADRDGHTAMTSGGTPCEGGTDCDDGAYAVHPGAPELCDGVDNDCDFVMDEDAWIMDGDPQVISGSGMVLDAALLAAGDDWIVAWIEDGSAGTSIRAGLFDADTGSVTADTLGETTGAAELEIMDAGEGEAVLVWIESGVSVRAKRIWFDPGPRQDPSVTLAGPALLVSEVSDLAAAATPDGTRGAVFFRGQAEGNPEITMLNVSLDPLGLLGSDNPVRISQAIGFSGFPAAAAGENVIVVVWEDERDGNKEIYSATVGLSDGELGRELRLTAAPGDSQRPSVSAAAGGFRVVWMDESEGPFNIMASLLDGGGQPLGYPVAMGGEARARYYPFASPDPRGTEGQEQNLIVYVTGQEQDLRLSAVGARSVEILEGLQLYSSPSLKIADPRISVGQSSRGLLWIEHSYSQSRLMFSIVRCL